MKSLPGWTSAYTESSSRPSSAMGSLIRVARTVRRFVSPTSAGGACAKTGHALSKKPAPAGNGEKRADTFTVVRRRSVAPLVSWFRLEAVAEVELRGARRTDRRGDLHERADDADVIVRRIEVRVVRYVEDVEERIERSPAGHVDAIARTHIERHIGRTVGAVAAAFVVRAQRVITNARVGARLQVLVGRRPVLVHVNRRVEQRVRQAAPRRQNAAHTEAFRLRHIPRSAG